MIRNLLLSILFLLFLFSCRNSNNNFETIIPSSDLKTHLYFSLNNGEPYYLVYYNNDIVIDWSMLGVVVDDTINFDKKLQVKRVESKTVSQNSDEFGSDLKVPMGICNEVTIQLKKADFDDIQFDIVFRAYNNAVAFKYFLRKIGSNRAVTEITKLILNNDTFSNLLRKDFSQDTVNSKIIPGKSPDTLNLPAIFVSEKGYEVAYFQSGSNNYPLVKLYRRTSEKLEYQMIYATDEEQSIQTDSVFETPWRIIYITNNQ